jgi:L-amino acid N-acyltransferase YncA
MSDTTTRAATPADIPVIAAIYGESVISATASFEMVPPDENEMARRLADLVAQNYPYLVAEGGSPRRILGYGYAGPYRNRPAYRNTVEDSIYLAADARGRGIGGVLLRQLIDISAERGFRQMVAIIADPEENEASLRLHKAAGFLEIGRLKDVGYKHGRWLDSIIMQRAIGAGAATPPA